MHPLLQNPPPGTVLIRPPSRRSKMMNNNNNNNNRKKHHWTHNVLRIRLATTVDDMDIANLRLSVFSNYSHQVRQVFCSRSCQVLANRRIRGATCLVATVPTAVPLDGRTGGGGGTGDDRQDLVLGSVECSVHEFDGTQLGRRRLPNSVLYITEVAVNPVYRRCGIGSTLLKGVDELASIRKVESLYLHVDVENEAALALYAKAGYSVVEASEPMYQEFTTSLNLHDGATQGRRHHLLCKHLTTRPTWLNDNNETNNNNNNNRAKNTNDNVDDDYNNDAAATATALPRTRSIGFEIPAK